MPEDKNCAESVLTGYEYENRMLVLKKVVADLLRLTPQRVFGDGREWHSSEGMPSEVWRGLASNDTVKRYSRRVDDD